MRAAFMTLLALRSTEDAGTYCNNSCAISMLNIVGVLSSGLKKTPDMSGCLGYCKVVHYTHAWLTSHMQLQSVRCDKRLQCLHCTASGVLTVLPAIGNLLWQCSNTTRSAHCIVVMMAVDNTLHNRLALPAADSID
jgi:hypothetical protein